MQRIPAKKGLGQHFLNDKNIARKIVQSLEPSACHTLIEVGPGKGVLTQYLLRDNTVQFIAVELDRAMIEILSDTFPDHTDQFIHADFLKFSLEGFKHPVAIIGNFPYFISSQILFKIIENRNTVNQVVCMIQKEVAERIASAHGSKKYGILSVLLQAYYNIEYLFTVHEHCFNPAPKVKSAVVRLSRNTTGELPCDPQLFFRIVKTAFNQRRKTLRNSLKKLSGSLPPDNSIMSMRPEQLSVDQFVELTLLFQK